MASRPFQTFTPGFGRSALDLPVAALAAVAVAFGAFAMPGDLMARLVDASGLPSLLAAAAPPLGLKARLGVSLIGAVAAFGVVFILLRLLDRTGFEARRPRPQARPEPRNQPQEEEVEETPRLRRRDFHPDAPARRPISAIRDLGEPAPPQPPIASPWPEAPAPLGWEAEPLAEPDFEPSPPLLADPEPEAQPDPAPEYRDEYVSSHVSGPGDEVRPIPEDSPEPAAPTSLDTQSASLDALMARLEQGLARRARPTPAPEPAPAPEEVPHEVDDRLQNAIESLQRFAARD